MGAVQRRVLVYGKHVVGDLYGCDERVLSDVEKLTKIVIEAARIGNMTLLDIKTWKIGLGISLVGIILESHISIHTWPEYRFATVDVYTCGRNSDPERSFEYIAMCLKAKRISKKIFLRSYEEDVF